MERNLRRHKNKKYPKVPRSAVDIIRSFEDSAVIQEFGFNLRKTKRFYIDTVEIDEKSSFTLFASHEIFDLVKKHILPNDRRYLMDGTFDVTPIGCHYQLLIIYIEYKNDVSFIITFINSLKCTF